MEREVDKVYLDKKIRVNRFAKALSLVELLGEKRWIRKWMEKHMPDAGEQLHFERRNEALTTFLALRKERNKLIKSEYEKVSSEPYSEAKAENHWWVSKLFPKEVQDKLIKMCSKMMPFAHIAHAHNTMLPAHLRVEIKAYVTHESED